jgi:drug/metabolite transporter (DMT)-like permease
LALLALALAGFFAAAGVYTNYLALQQAPVVVVQPLTATNPLFTILLARIFLPAERPTLRLVLGILLIILGVAIIGLSTAR